MSLGPRSLFVDDAAAASIWVATADSALRGINHAMGNRLFVLFALPPGEQGLQTASETAERIERLLTLARHLELADQFDPEPIALADATATVTQFLAHHPRLRDLTPTVVLQDRLAPTLAPRTALVQALLVLLTTCGEAAMALDGTRSFGLEASSDADWVTLQVHGGGAPHERAAALRCACALLQGTHVEGDCEDGGGRITLRLPTLAHARRAERSGAATDPG